MRRWGESPWRGTPIPARPVANSTPDVAIVGGGFTGIAAAWHLARLGLAASVFEAEAVGDGASGRTGGIVLEGTARGIIERADRCVPALAQLVDEAGIDCDLRLPGCWEIAHGGDAGAGMLPWHDNGERIGIVRTVPGGAVDPMALLTQLAAAAVRAGALIHEHARVRRLVVEPHPVLELDGAVISPRFVIVAVNAWTADLLARVRPVQSALTFACATEPLDQSTLAAIGLAEAVPFYTVDTPYLWGRQTRDGRVVFGAGLTYDTPARLERLNVETAEPAAALARLEARVRGLHRALNTVRITHRWAGPIAIPARGTPIAARLEQNRDVLVAGGYMGHGVALSFRLGQLLARAIAHGEPLPDWGRT